MESGPLENGDLPDDPLRIAEVIRHGTEQAQLQALKAVLAGTASSDLELLKAFAASDTRVAGIALEALAERDPAGARGLARRQVRSRYLGVRASAARVLASFLAPDLTGGLIALTHDEDSHVVAAALRSLEQLDDPRLAERAGELLANPSPEVQMAAASVLARQSSAERIPYLRMALDSAIPDVRSSAIRALERHPIPESERLILDHIGDADGDVADNALDALATVGGEMSLPHLQALIKSAPPLSTIAKRSLRAIYERLRASHAGDPP